VTYRTVEQRFSNRHNISNPFFDMSAFDLPFADVVLKPHYILSTGATSLTTILLDYRHMYHNLVCIINEAEDFYEVSHDIIMTEFDDSCKENAVTSDDLLESLVDVDAYRNLLVIKNICTFQ
jgi:hypothetical protein